MIDACTAVAIREGLELKRTIKDIHLLEPHDLHNRLITVIYPLSAQAVHKPVEELKIDIAWKRAACLEKIKRIRMGLDVRDVGTLPIKLSGRAVQRYIVNGDPDSIVELMQWYVPYADGVDDSAIMAMYRAVHYKADITIGANPYSEQGLLRMIIDKVNQGESIKWRSFLNKAA